MNTAETINFDIPIEEVDIPMEPEEQNEDWSEFDNYEFQINETFVDVYNYGSVWLRLANNGLYSIGENKL